VKKSEVAALLAAFRWCLDSNVSVRFESNKTVSIRFNNTRRRRKTFMEAVQAARDSTRKER